MILMHKVGPFLLIDFNEMEKCSQRIYSSCSWIYIKSMLLLCFCRAPTSPNLTMVAPVVLAAQIPAALVLILVIEYKGDPKDNLKETSPPGSCRSVDLIGEEE